MEKFIKTNNNKMETIHISVLDYNNYEVINYKAELKTDFKTCESEVVEEFLTRQGHNLDEVSYMFGFEPITITDNTGYQE